MNVLIHRVRATGPLISRVVAALFGGYALAALASLAALALPLSKPQAVLTGMLASFAIYAAAVVWVFAARNALKAWAGLMLVAAALSPLAWSVS